MYDAIVIGARCAGSPTAMLLARNGYRVLAVDRDTFPSDTMSTHVLAGDAIARLDRWGLFDRVLATGVRQCTRPFAMVMDGVDYTWDFLPPSPYPQVAPRRTYLDKVLVDAARESGVEVREGFSVQGLLWEEGQVVGVRGFGPDRVEVEERARIVIGADGKWSKVARWVGADEYNTLPGRGCFFYSYWTGVESVDRMEIHSNTATGAVAFVFPTNDGQVCMGVGRPGADWQDFKRDPEATVEATLDEVPWLLPKIAGRKRIEHLQGLNMYESCYRKPFGPGWALVGDSGYLKDPMLGQGINDAFRDAEYLVEAIHAGFSGQAPLDVALAGYQQRRDGETAGLYWLNDLFAQGPTPEKVEIARQALTQAMAEASAGA